MVTEDISTSSLLNSTSRALGGAGVGGPDERTAELVRAAYAVARRRLRRTSTVPAAMVPTPIRAISPRSAPVKARPSEDEEAEVAGVPEALDDVTPELGLVQPV
jgi:hypothetical protein